MTKALSKRRWGADVSPWRELNFLSDRMSGMLDADFFEPFVMPSLWGEDEGWMPAVELMEKDGEYLLTAELPGVAKEDVDVSVTDGVLTFKGEKKSEKEEAHGKTHYRERRYGAFERSFTLPREVMADKIKAEFENGVVQIHLPKGETIKGRKIKLT